MVARKRYAGVEDKTSIYIDFDYTSSALRLTFYKLTVYVTNYHENIQFRTFFFFLNKYSVPYLDQFEYED